MLRKLSALFMLLLLAAVFFALPILGASKKHVSSDASESLQSIGGVQSTSLDNLIAAFGCDVPHDRASGVGVVEDVTLGSLNARILRWQRDSGLVISAVRPANAAQLLREDGLELDTQHMWTVDGAGLITATGARGSCAYYATEDAAYSLFLAGADTDALLSAVAILSFPH